MAGPGTGRPRSELCLGALACIRRTKCNSGPDSMPCYCGQKDLGECLTPGMADGACRAELEAASETTDPMLVG